jgi:DNA-binding transcriptional ArsR family regulator
VGELAASLPVSRPAVSQHLRVLESAGLVTHRKNGTRHLYELDRNGVVALRSWVDGFWDEALARFKAVADTKGEKS